MKRHSFPDPDQPLGFTADLAAKVRAQYIEAIDPALEDRHLDAMTQAFRKAESSRSGVAGRWRRTMTTGFLASTAAKVAAAFFAALIATGSALAATGNLDVVQEVLPGAEEAADESDDDLSEPGNEGEAQDADEAKGGDGENAVDEAVDPDTDAPDTAEGDGPEDQAEAADPDESDDCDEDDADPAEEAADDPEDAGEVEDCNGGEPGGDEPINGAVEESDEEIE